MRQPRAVQVGEVQREGQRDARRRGQGEAVRGEALGAAVGPPNLEGIGAGQVRHQEVGELRRRALVGASAGLDVAPLAPRVGAVRLLAREGHAHVGVLGHSRTERALAPRVLLAVAEANARAGVRAYQQAVLVAEALPPQLRDVAGAPGHAVPPALLVDRPHRLDGEARLPDGLGRHALPRRGLGAGGHVLHQLLRVAIHVVPRAAWEWRQVELGDAAAELRQHELKGRRVQQFL
mmetsp:Transcript_76577/g.234446  ORF Transcript_76577/g.234446 Transcript_76577/m.234446 type:complete len:235 (+) Transcript_76577:2950-3654(+)